MILRDARPDEIDAILAQTHALWSEGLDEAAYRDYVRTLLSSDWAKAGNYRFLVYTDEPSARPVAALKLYRFDARLEEIPIRIGGVGAVFTIPEERGRGHAGEMIARTHRLMAERGDAFSLLYSEIGAVYYAQIGYQELDPHPVKLAVPASGRAPDGLKRMHRNDIDHVVALHQADNASAAFALTRDRGYWNYLLARASYPTLHLGRERWESRIMLAGREGYLWSMFRSGPGGTVVRLLDFAESRPGAALPALIDELFEECRRRGAAEVDAWLPPAAVSRDPRLEKLVTHIPSASCVPMWFPLDEDAATGMRRCGSAAGLRMGDAF